MKPPSALLASMARQRNIGVADLADSGSARVQALKKALSPAPPRARSMPTMTPGAEGAVSRAIRARTGTSAHEVPPGPIHPGPGQEVTIAGEPPALGPAFPDHSRIPLTPMRRIIATRLSASKATAPHYYMSMDVGLDALMDMRAQLNLSLQPRGMKLSLNDLFLKVVSVVVARHPLLNAAWMGDHIASFTQVNLAVAVAIDGGLVTPVLRNAAGKGLRALATEMGALLEAARRRALPAEAFDGGTFTISNLGMYGVKDFQAIINPPQAAILAIAGARRELVPGTEGNRGPGGEPASHVEHRTTLTLSVDHRVADGVAGAEFLNDLRQVMEEPRRLLL